MKKLILFVTTLLVLPTVPSWATNFYVSTTGSDSNSCTTAQSPTATNAKRTIAAGFTCLSLGAAGDHLKIHAGTYSDAGIDSNTIDILNGGGSWATATVIESVNGTVTWNFTGSLAAIAFKSTDSYITIRGTVAAPFIFDGVNSTRGSFGAHGFRLVGSNHIEFDGVEMKNAKYNGIYSDLDTSNVWIHNSYFHNNGQDNYDHGIYMEGDTSIVEYNRIENHFGTCTQFYNGHGGSGSTSDNNIYRYNYCANGDDGGVVIEGANNQVHHNIIYSNGKSTAYRGGIVCGYSGSTGLKAYNNTIHAQDGYGIVLGQLGSCTGVDIRNNSISSNTQECVYKASGTVDGTIAYNNCNGNGNNTIPAITGVTQTNTTTFAPNYVNAGSLDFGLNNATGAVSQLIDAAPPLTGFFYNGTVTNKADIGAFETITFASAKILNDATDNKMEITFNNNATPGVLPVANCSGFSATKSTVDNPIVSCARTAPNVITLTLFNSYTSATAAAFTYVTATGNVTDSSLIGNFKNQRLNALTNQGADVTNLAGGGSTPLLTQVQYKFRSFGGTEANPDGIGPLNTGVTIPPNSGTVLIGQVSNTVANMNAAGYSLYAQRNGTGGYLAVPNGPCASTGICFVTGTGILPPELMAGPTTEKLAGAGTFVPGGVQISNGEVPTVSLTTGQDTELAAALWVGSGNSAGDYFDIHWCRAGVGLDAYTQTPRITIGGYTAKTGAP